MKTTALAAIGALMLAAGGAPAMAGGYWDGGIVHEGPPPAESRWDAGDCGCRHARHQEREWRGREDDRRYEEDEVALPYEFFEGGGGVGPDTFVDEAGGGGFAVVGGFADASAFASASVNVAFRERMHHHDHDMMHHMPMKGWGGNWGGGGRHR